MKDKDRFLDLSIFVVSIVVLGLGSRRTSDLKTWPSYNNTHLYFTLLGEKHIGVAQVFNTTLNLSFHMALVVDKLAKWKELVAEVAFMQLDD